MAQLTVLGPNPEFFVLGRCPAPDLLTAVETTVPRPAPRVAAMIRMWCTWSVDARRSAGVAGFGKSFRHSR
jgi:hypothetical protein